MPAWVEEGIKMYQQRLTHYFSLHFTEIPLKKRGKGVDVERLKNQEGQLMLAAIKPQSRVIALDVLGDSFDTLQLSQMIKTHRDQGQDITLLIGGPEGLSTECLQRADRKWSLSPLTFPHTLVRIMLLEALYRAMTLLTGHPYHRI